MAATKRTKSQIMRDRAVIADMLLERRTVRGIAAELGKQYPGGLAASTVQRDVEAVRSEWRERAADSYDTMLAEELARLAHLERRAWEAFDQSTRSTEVRTLRRVTGSTGQGAAGIEVTKTTVDPPGSAPHLQIVLRSIETRCRLLGFHLAPGFGGGGGEIEPVFTLDLGEGRVLPEQAE